MAINFFSAAPDLQSSARDSLKANLIAEQPQSKNLDNSRTNQVAFCVTTGLAVATMGSVYALTNTASTAAQVAYGLLAITSAGASVGSISAWLDTDSKNLETYFARLHHHSGIAIAGMYQFAAQTMVQAVIQGVSQGISTGIRRKISGPDFITEQKMTGFPPTRSNESSASEKEKKA